MTVQRVFLIGLSGSGKTTVGRALARELGWEFADSDEIIEARTERDVKTLFEERGEAAFRELEVEVLSELGRRERVVVATGGGVPTEPRNARVLASGLVIWLDITPQGARRRLLAAGGVEERPLLRDDPAARLEALFESRRPLYERCDRSIAVDYYDVGQVVRKIVEIIEEAEASGWSPEPGRFGGASGEGGREGAGRVAATVRTASATYPVVVKMGVLEEVGEICREVELEGRAFVLSDRNVASLFGESVLAGLRAAGYEACLQAIRPGEAEKTLATVGDVYDWLLGERIERSDFLVCLGGGVVTDLGGFAAATVLRGVPFVHVPTTMVGMVDAAIGGKTGVDHERGKNLIGAFAQPRAVIADPGVLGTLPEREVRAGCAELIKHSFILDRGLVGELEAARGDLRRLTAAGLIARSAAIKAAVVSGDEREAGVRTLLNYGHTVGHAIEAVTGYAGYLHGEAVAVGMRAAGLISMAVAGLGEEEFRRQQALIRACGLPESAPGVSPEAVLEAMKGDKKVRQGRVRWVLLERLGRAVVRDDVEVGLVREVVEAVVGS